MLATAPRAVSYSAHIGAQSIIRPSRIAREPVEKQTARELFSYIVEQGKKDYQVQRYKGLGEMTSTQLWETTMDPERRTLLSVKLEDIAETETGLLVTIRRSKTDQDGEGVTIAIARGDVACPARALREWLDAAGIDRKLIAGTVQNSFIGPQLKRHLDYMEAELTAHPWFTGTEFTAADVQMSFPLEAAKSRAGLSPAAKAADPANAA